jgi:hypothetical protein
MNETAVTVERTDARKWSDEQMEDLFSNGFPPFIIADRLAKQYIGRVREWFPEWNLILVDAIPAGLSVLHINREADLGTYVEPNIWIRHR